METEIINEKWLGFYTKNSSSIFNPPSFQTLKELNSFNKKKLQVHNLNKSCFLKWNLSVLYNQKFKKMFKVAIF